MPGCIGNKLVAYSKTGLNTSETEPAPVTWVRLYAATKSMVLANFLSAAELEHE
jgi:hypothetical protein